MFFQPEIETMPREELRELQLERMRESLRNAYENVPLYRERFDAAGVTPDDLTSLEDIAKFPFVVKQDMRDNYPFGMFARENADVARIHASSGTTGQATVVGHTANDLANWGDCFARGIAMVGGDENSTIQVSYGYGLFTGGLGAHAGGEAMGCTVIPTSSGNTKRQVQMLKDCKTDILACTPSYALLIADTAIEMGYDPATEFQISGGIFGAGQRCVEPIGDVVFDPTFVVCLHKSMGVPFNDRDPEYDEWLNLDYHDFIQAGGSVGYEEQEYRVLKDATDWWKTEEYPDGPDFPQYAAKFQEEGWFDCRKWHPERWGTYRRWEMGYRRQQAGYNLYAAVDEKCAFGTPTGKVEIWSTICESYIGDTVTESYVLETPGTAAKVGEKTPYFAQVCSPDRDAYAGDIPDIDKFPHWFEPKNSRVQAPEWYDANLVDGASYNSDNYLNKPYHGIAGVGNGQATDNGTTDNLEAYKQAVKENPEATFICTSGARQPVYFHSEHRQLPWCRELWPSPRFEMNPNDAARLGIEQGDWIWVRTPWGAIREVADLYYGIKEGTTNANHAWWYPEMDHAAHGFELVGINCTMDKYAQCWICGASQLRGNPMVVYKATEENSPFGNPVPCDPWGNEAITNANDPRLKEWLANDPRLDDSKVELTYASADAKGLQTLSLIKE